VPDGAADDQGAPLARLSDAWSQSDSDGPPTAAAAATAAAPRAPRADRAGAGCEGARVTTQRHGPAAAEEPSAAPAGAQSSSSKLCVVPMGGRKLHTESMIKVCPLWHVPDGCLVAAASIVGRVVSTPGLLLDRPAEIVLWVAVMACASNNATHAGGACGCARTQTHRLT
jgi:hypothetical protein